MTVEVPPVNGALACRSDTEYVASDPVVLGLTLTSTPRLPLAPIE